MEDLVYYLEVEGVLLPECFECEDDAIEYAVQNGLDEYEIVEWDVD
jgi:hypothetical protein